jgi:hypothetical protein
MVQAYMNISERSNKILNVIKALHGFKDKSQTLDYILEKYEENELNAELLDVKNDE